MIWGKSSCGGGLMIKGWSKSKNLSNCSLYLTSHIFPCECLLFCFPSRCFSLSWDLILLMPSFKHATLKERIRRLMFYGDDLAGRGIQWCGNVDHSVLRGYALRSRCVGVVEQVLFISGSLPCFFVLSRLVNVIGRHWHKHTNIKYQLDSPHTHMHNLSLWRECVRCTRHARRHQRNGVPAEPGAPGPMGEYWPRLIRYHASIQSEKVKMKRKD